jgi:lysylphosphatidylglycerol synthetase-like protein (DUF2156 family)
VFRVFRKALWPSRNDRLARSFSSLGWLGFWMQIAVGSVPLVLTIYALAFGRNAAPSTRAGFPLIEYLSIAGLVVLAFTTIWSFRYTRLAVRLTDSTRRPTRKAVQRTVWTGVKASTLGIALSMLVLLFEVVQLLIYFLRTPQAGVPVIQTTGGPASWVSAADMAGLLALLLTMFAEVTILAFSLWLLFRTTLPSVEFPEIDDEEI